MNNFLRLCAVLLPACCLSASMSAVAQNVPAVTEGTNLKLDLSASPVGDLMDAIARQTGRPVMLDGVISARRITLHIDGSVSAVLESVSKVLDVDWRQRTDGAILLTKRFSRSEEIPQTDVAEMHALAQTVLRTLPNSRLLKNATDWSQDIQQLARMLDPIQVDTLKRGGVIPWSSLNPAQKTQAAGCIYGRLYGMPRLYWSQLLFATDDPDKTYLIMEPENRQLMLKVPDKVWPEPLPFIIAMPENPQATDHGTRGGLDPEHPLSTSKQPVAGLHDGNVNSQVDLEPHPRKLNELCRELTRQTGVAVTIPPFLENRRTTIAAHGRSLRSLLDALCDLEKWTWKPIAGGAEAVIDGPTAGVRPGESIYAAVRRILPPDLVNYFRMPAANNPTKGYSPAVDAVSDRHDDVRNRVLTFAPSYVAELKRGDLTLSRLKPNERDLCLLALMVSPRSMNIGGELLGNGHWLMASPEKTALRFDKTMLLFDCYIDGQGTGSFGTQVTDAP